MKQALLALSVFLSFCAAAAAQMAATSGVKGDRELGQYLSSECVTCHQASGRQSDGVPTIVGWPEDQFVAVMLAYKNNDREHQVMRTVAARLSKEEIAALAAYFGELKKPQ